MRTNRTALAFLAALLFSVALPAQAPEATASWKVTANAVSDNEYELLFTASIVDGWHIYTTAHQFNPTEVVFDSPAGYEPQGSLRVRPVPMEGAAHPAGSNREGRDNMERLQRPVLRSPGEQGVLGHAGVPCRRGGFGRPQHGDFRP